jgi:hypothetical protein
MKNCFFSSHDSKSSAIFIHKRENIKSQIISEKQKSLTRSQLFTQKRKITARMKEKSNYLELKRTARIEEDKLKVLKSN